MFDCSSGSYVNHSRAFPDRVSHTHDYLGLASPSDRSAWHSPEYCLFKASCHFVNSSYLCISNRASSWCCRCCMIVIASMATLLIESFTPSPPRLHTCFLHPNHSTFDRSVHTNSNVHLYRDTFFHPK